MITVKFGDKDSYKDWGLILKPKKRPFPDPKTKEVSIEGRDGVLDLTTSLTSDVKYQNVTYSLEFTLLDKRADWETKLYEISTYLHGKKMNVIFSDDPDWYCVGRVSLNELTSNKSLGVISLDCNFEPYRLKAKETIINEEIVANKTITLSNSRKWVMPSFTVESKNLLNSKIGTTTTNGVTVSYDEETQVITLNGTCTKDNTTFSFYRNINASNPVVIESDETLYSKVVYVSGSSTGYFSLRAFDQNWSNSLMNTTTTGVSGDLNKSHSYGKRVEYTRVDIRLGADSVCNNLQVKLMFSRSDLDYEPYVENASVNFNVDGNEYSFSGTLKTPDIILKEDGSKITLTGGEGNIRISYREGKL